MITHLVLAISSSHARPTIVARGGSAEDVIEMAAQAVGDDQESIIMMRDELGELGAFSVGRMSYHVISL